MKFLKKKIVTTQTKQVVKKSELPRLLPITDKLTFYTPNLTTKFAKMVNDKVNLTCVIDDSALNYSMLYQKADHLKQSLPNIYESSILLEDLFEIKSHIKNYESNKHNLVELKAMLDKMLKEYYDNQKFLQKLAKQDTLATRDFKVILRNIEPLTWAQKDSPHLYTSDEIATLSNNIRTQRNLIGVYNNQWNNKDLVVNGYIIKKNNLISLEMRQQIEIEKCDGTLNDLELDASKEQTE